MAENTQSRSERVPDAVADGAGEMVWPQTNEPEPDPQPSELPREPHEAIVVCVARNLLNTVDTRPSGYAWFSA